MKAKLLSTTGAAAALLWVVGAHAALIDPSTLFIGNGVTGTCLTGATGASPCEFLFNGNLNGAGNSEVGAFSAQLDIYQNQGNRANLNNPVLLIFAVPNDSGTALTASSVSSPTLLAPATATSGTGIGFSFSGTDPYTHGTWNAFATNLGFNGDMTATT